MSGAGWNVTLILIKMKLDEHSQINILSPVAL